MAPDLAQFEREYKTRLPVLHINVDQKTATFEYYLKYTDTYAIPNTILIKNGKVIYSKVGPIRYAELKRAIDPLLSTLAPDRRP